jgi:cytochrome c553
LDQDPGLSAARHRPVKVERGKDLYIANACSFCHGADARGGNGGPSLVRSQRVMRDREGELIAEPIVKGVSNTTMVAFPLTQEQISDIAEFLHYEQTTRRQRAVITVSSSSPATLRLVNATLRSNASSCHSAEGDLKDSPASSLSPKRCWQRWLLPTGTATSAVITLPDGSRHEGRLVRQGRIPHHHRAT